MGELFERARLDQRGLFGDEGQRAGLADRLTQPIPLIRTIRPP